MDSKVSVIFIGTGNTIEQIKKAEGEFLAFFDCNETIDDSILTEMYTVAREQRSDMIVCGIDGDRISAFDKQLNKSLSLNGKLFKKKIIEDCSLELVDSTEANCVLFTQQFIHRCNVITGFKKIDGWNREELTLCEEPEFGKKDRASLLRTVNAIKAIEETVVLDYEKKQKALLSDNGTEKINIEEFECQFKEYRSDLLANLVDYILLGYYFRDRWNIEEIVLDELKKEINILRTKIFSSDWNRIIERNKDLELNKKVLLSEKEILDAPIVSFVISGTMDNQTVIKVVNSIYNQRLPFFEVFVDEKYQTALAYICKNRNNIHFIEHVDNRSLFKKKHFDKIKSQYVIFIDEPVFMRANTVFNMFEGIIDEESNEIYDFIAVPFINNAGNTYSSLEANSCAYINEFVKRVNRTPYNQLDCFWSNKMFKVVYLRGSKVLFYGDPWKDINKLYNNSNYIKRPQIQMPTSLTDNDVLRNVRSRRVRALYKSKLRKDRRIQKLFACQDIPYITREEQFKQWRLWVMRRSYKFITRKIVYPIYYRWCARKPVDEHKVIFIEARRTSLTNSVMQLYDRFAQSGEYTIHEHYLRDRYARYRQQYKSGMNFIKDFATAKYAITSEADETISSPRKRKETIVVNTWHGCGAFKKFGFSTADKIFGGSLKQKQRYPLYKNLDIVTVSSPEVVWAFEEAMNLKGKNVVKPLGVSRTDVFFDNDFISEAAKRIQDALPEIGNRKIIFYAPTFRGRISSAYGPDELNLDRMAEELSEDYVLLIKHHPMVKRPPQIPPQHKNKFAFDVTNSISIDDLICAGDICISDYSSLIYEFSLFDKPIIFFAYDLDEYFDWRGFYYDYNELTPGPIVSGTEEIIHYINNLDTMFDVQQLYDFRERFMSSCDGNATDRIMATMEELCQR